MQLTSTKLRSLQRHRSRSVAMEMVVESMEVASGVDGDGSGGTSVEEQSQELWAS